MSEKVFEIGNHSLWRKNRFHSTPSDKECSHRNLVADDDGQVITCKDCDRQVSAYWVVMNWAQRLGEALETMRRKREQLQKDIQQGIVLRAAQVVEKAWRSRTMVPTCPHCGAGIGPKDGFGGTMVSKFTARGGQT